jgi:hypothetical protein
MRSPCNMLLAILDLFICIFWVIWFHLYLQHTISKG